jgi:hypothetical protein
MLYGSLMISFPAANFASIYIYTYGGYLAVFGTSFGLGLLTLLYIIFFITDSRGQGARYVNMNISNEELEEPSPPANCSSVISNLWECFYVTFQPRNGHKRACIIVLLMSMCFYVFASEYNLKINTASNEITKMFNPFCYLFQFPVLLLIFTHASYLDGINHNLPYFLPFHLLQQLQVTRAARACCIHKSTVKMVYVLGSLFLLPLLSSCLKVNDCVIGIIALVGNIIGSLVIAFATSPLIFYLGKFEKISSLAVNYAN